MIIKYLLTIAVSLFVFTSVVHSQTPEPEIPVGSVTLDQLERDYFFQIEKYRETEEKYNFEVAENRKIGTLASQEDALEAMKNIMIARASTLRAYLATVERQVWDANSIDIGLKQESLDKLKLAQLTLKTHEEEVPSLFDKDNILTTSSEFEKQIGDQFEAQYRGLSLVAINRVQSALDDLVLAANDFEDEQVILIENEAIKAANIRGLKEVSQQINTARDAISEALAEYDQFDKPFQTNSGDIYNRVVNKLLPAHSSLNKAIDFLIELERGL